MASTQADAATSKAGKSGGSLWLVSVLVLTLFGAGGGWFIGTQIVAMIRGADSPKPKDEPASPASAYSGDTVVKELPPIVTNLAIPEGSWIRLQASIVYDKKLLSDPDVNVLSAHIVDDILGFVKTLSAPQIQGASGLQHLREDLNERVALRSEGHVRELIIETLVIQ
jgi:flagellar FliL protein